MLLFIFHVINTVCLLHIWFPRVRNVNEESIKPPNRRQQQPNDDLIYVSMSATLPPSSPSANFLRKQDNRCVKQIAPIMGALREQFWGGDWRGPQSRDTAGSCSRQNRRIKGLCGARHYGGAGGVMITKEKRWWLHASMGTWNPHWKSSQLTQGWYRCFPNVLLFPQHPPNSRSTGSKSTPLSPIHKSQKPLSFLSLSATCHPSQGPVDSAHCALRAAPERWTTTPTPGLTHNLLCPAICSGLRSGCHQLLLNCSSCPLCELVKFGFPFFIFKMDMIMIIIPNL